MIQVLNITAGCCGIVAGILWFFAAWRTPTPPIGAYFDIQDGPDSPFVKAWRKATWLNQAAAVMTGISSMLFGLTAFF
jgi:hypothetical protein